VITYMEGPSSSPPVHHVRGRISLNVGDVQVSCVPVPKSVKNGSRVSVTVSYSLDPITPFVGQWIGSFDLTKTAEAERFYDTCPA